MFFQAFKQRTRSDAGEGTRSLRASPFRCTDRDRARVVISQFAELPMDGSVKP